jgi:hypothetical protein
LRMQAVRATFLGLPAAELRRCGRARWRGIR